MRIAPFITAAGLILAVVCDVASGQISAPEGKWVVAHSADIASKCADYIKSKYSESKSESAFEDAELVRIVTAAPSSWEFYSRDRGILIAIDAGTDVSLAVRNSGPSKIARAAEAVIRQERDMAISDRVMVIFIDHATREIGMRQSNYRPVYSPGIPSDSHAGWGNGSYRVESTPSGGFPNFQACGCR